MTDSTDKATDEDRHAIIQTLWSRGLFAQRLRSAVLASPATAFLQTNLLCRATIEMFMIGIRVGACLVNRAVDMLGWPIDRVKPERFGTGAYHVMPGSLGDDDAIVRLDLVAHAIDPDFPFAPFDAEELVTIIVNLFPDLIARLNGHEDKLEIAARVKHATEIAILFHKLFDIVDEALHSSMLLSNGHR